MPSCYAAILLCALGQAAGRPDARVKAIDPFVDSDVYAIVQIDLTRADLPALAARLAGKPSPSMVADAMKLMVRWSEGLQRAGGRELDLVFSTLDILNPPFVVVPLA